jgi:hypothetical protein
MIKQIYLLISVKGQSAMLQPEPRLLKFMKLTTQSRTPDKVRLSTATQILIIYSLVAFQEHEAQEAPAACTALTTRRKHGIFSIRRMGAGR